jgi:hypothetical protein
MWSAVTHDKGLGAGPIESLAPVAASMTVRAPKGWISVAVSTGKAHAIAPGITTCWSKVIQTSVGLSRARSTPPQGKRPLMAEPLASVHKGLVIGCGPLHPSPVPVVHG